MSQTLVEKITQRYVLDANHEVKSGDFVNVRPAYILTHDNSYAVIQKYRKLSNQRIFDPNKIVIALDHDIQNKSESNLKKYSEIEKFARENHTHFYPAGRGIGHQVMCEEGFVIPNTFVVASDSHANMYGALGALGTPVTRTDAVSVWTRGFTWWQVPPVVKVNLTGKLNPGVVGKDLIVALCGIFNNDEVLNSALEFYGEGLRSLSIPDRMSIANMSTEWGAQLALFPYDRLTQDWFEKRKKYVPDHPRINAKTLEDIEPLQADKNAQYAVEIDVDLSAVEPCVSGPNSVKVMKTISEIKKEKIKIDKAYLVSCVNSRVEDIAQAAHILKDKKVHDGVKLYVAAASSQVQKESEKRGDWQTLIDAGAIILPPGCGPCIGLGQGILEDGEVGISATNRNFEGRMGSRNALAYLASPAVVAASALHGYISDMDGPSYAKASEGKPADGANKHMKIRKNLYANTNSETKTEIIPKFPTEIKGKAVFCLQGNINTDGIYPGKYTYEELSLEEQAKVTMMNYDSDFRTKAQGAQILLAGANFGTGSSREQAATSLKAFGFEVIVASSFNETYKRNAFNNGLLLIECPEFINVIKSKTVSNDRTQRIKEEVTIDFRNSNIIFTSNIYKFSPLSSVAQELIVQGGLENTL